MGISPAYVLDRMEMYEVHSLLKYSYFRHKDSWERARFMSYVQANCAGAKLQKMQDVVSFDWDKEPAADIPQLTPEQIKAKWEKARRTAELLNQQQAEHGTN